jgi:hypothetical protein
MFRSLLTAKKRDMAPWNPFPEPEQPSESFSFISPLPLEILAKIFEIVVENDDIQPLDLAIVCRKWRDTIYAHPRFWMTRRCSTSNPPSIQRSTNLVPHLQRWFERAGTLPLTLKLTMTSTLSTEELLTLTVFLVENTRWHSLHLKWDNSMGSGWHWFHSLFSAVLQTEGLSCWETLQKLEIEARGICLQDDVQLPFSSIAPNLCELKISLHQIEDAACLIQASFIPKKLRHLEIDSWVWWDADNLPIFWYRTKRHQSRVPQSCEPPREQET